MISVSSAAGALRVHYAKNLSDILMANPLMADSSLCALLTKRKGDIVKQAQGSAYAIPIKSKRTQAANYSFAKAQANSAIAAKGSQFDTFLVPVVYGAAVGRVDGTANAILKGDQNGFVDALQSETDDMLHGLQNEIALHSFKKGTGSRGQVASVTSTTVTLLNRSDLVNFEIGQSLLAAAADGTGSAKTSTFVITGINWQTGVLTGTGDPTASTAWAANDYMFVDGDFVASTNTKIQGLGAWCPTTAPTVSNEPTFCGVARYNNPRLVGVRRDMSASTDLSQAFLDISADCQLLSGKKYTHFFGNPLDWAAYTGGFDDKRFYTVENKETHVGFNAAKVITPWGITPFLPDRDCPKGVVYGINDAHLFFICADDDLVKIVDEDGQTVTRAADADAFETRGRSLANMACDDPSTLGVLYNVTT